MRQGLFEKRVDTGGDRCFTFLNREPILGTLRTPIFLFGGQVARASPAMMLT